MIRSTLTDPTGIVHRVSVPDIPADFPNGGSVVVTADCGRGRQSDAIPAHLARKTSHPSFTGRLVTCLDCLDRVGQEG
jgi:hypothetical protein